MEIVSRDNRSWFVLRVTYQRELIAKTKLDELNIENFVPIQKVRVKGKSGRLTGVTKVLLHNYIFVYTVKSQIDILKRGELPFLRYVMYNDENGLRKIQTVPERQMKNFIAIAGTEDERVMFLNPEEVDLSKGDKVRVLGGPFEGVEGHFMRVINGKREKRVVVKITGVAAIATASLPVSLVEKID